MASLRCDRELGFDLGLLDPRDTFISLGVLCTPSLSHGILGCGVHGTGCITGSYLSLTPGHLALLLMLRLGPLQPRGCFQR